MNYTASQRENTQEIASMANEFANDDPEFAEDQNSDLFMVRAAFDAYEGPMVTENYFKLGLVLDGEGSIFNRTDISVFESKFHRNSLFAMLPGICGETCSSPMNMLGFFIDFEKLGLTQNPSHLEAISTGFFEDETIQSVMLALWQSSQCASCSSLFIREGVEVLVNHLLQLASGSQLSCNNKLREEKLMRRVKAFVAENLDKRLAVDDLADAAGVPYDRFFLICRRETGMTPFAYLTYCRMQRAKEHLRNGASIVEAGLEVSYSNPSKFAAAFKRHCGVTPRQWKRR